RLGAAASTTVLARGVRALLEVLDGLRGEREPKGSREARLAARTGDVGHEVYLLFACVESSLAAADSATHITAATPRGPRSTTLVTPCFLWSASRRLPAGAACLVRRLSAPAHRPAQQLIGVRAFQHRSA